MNGKKLRWHESQRRRTEHYRAAQRAAVTGRQRASVEYDHARGVVSQLPEQDRDAAWRELAGVLESWAAGLAVKLTPPPGGRAGAQRTATRPRVRRHG